MVGLCQGRKAGMSRLSQNCAGRSVPAPLRWSGAAVAEHLGAGGSK